MNTNSFFKFRSILALIFCLAALTSHSGTLVIFRTTLGDMEVELFDQDKPITSRNFLRYAQGGFYRDSIFHRCPVNSTSGSSFVVQGGGLFVTNRNTTANSLLYIPTFPAITNEYGVGRSISNTYATIAMAKTDDPNSATSQFFFNLGDNRSSLDLTNNSGGFTVFGRVVRGTNVLNQFIGRKYWQGVVNFDGGMLAELPVNFVGYKSQIYFSDLIYVDNVETLTTRMTRTNGVPSINWRSVAGKMNYVEYTRTLPAVWQTLWAGQGTGNAMTCSDSTTNAGVRLYRVRVDY